MAFCSSQGLIFCRLYICFFSGMSSSESVKSSVSLSVIVFLYFGGHFSRWYTWRTCNLWVSQYVLHSLYQETLLISFHFFFFFFLFVSFRAALFLITLWTNLFIMLHNFTWYHHLWCTFLQIFCSMCFLFSCINIILCSPSLDFSAQHPYHYGNVSVFVQ